VRPKKGGRPHTEDFWGGGVEKKGKKEKKKGPQGGGMGVPTKKKKKNQWARLKRVLMGSNQGNLITGRYPLLTLTGRRKP